MPDEQQIPDAIPEARSPLEFLAQFPGAPSSRQIEDWKRQSPNGRLKLFAPDHTTDPRGGRVYLVRPISGLDEKQLRAEVPASSLDPNADFQVATVARAVLWTNTKTNGRMEATDLRAAAAGLAQSLFAIVEQLSDFYPPAQLFEMTIEI